MSLEIKDKLQLKINTGIEGNRYLSVTNYVLYPSDYRVHNISKDRIKDIIEKQRAKIELAAKQLNDMEKMSEEL